MDNYKEAQSQYKNIYDIASIAFKDLAKNMGLIAYQVAIVATYNSTTKMATVYFPSDLTTPSNEYLNLTNANLVVGQKVYLFHKIGDVEQGWIMAK